MTHHVADLIAELDVIGRAGSVAVVKIDGERHAASIYTVVVSGGLLGVEFFRNDGADLSARSALAGLLDQFFG